jgi:hypothetical protein
MCEVLPLSPPGRCADLCVRCRGEGGGEAVTESLHKLPPSGLEYAIETFECSCMYSML